MRKEIIIWGMVFLILVGGVLGLGLRPAKTVIDFMPGLVREGEFWVVNNDEMDFEVNIYVEGELGKYVELEQKKLVFKEDDDARRVGFKVRLPEKLPSGEVKASIVVEEVLSGERNPYEFTAKIVLKHKLIVESPYPVKFVEGKLDFEDKGDKVGLVSEVKNLGSETIEKIKTKFYVNDRREKIEAVESGEESLGVGESKKLEAEIEKKKVEYGEFDILAAIFYDNYKLELEKKLIMGEPEIEILYFDRYFIFGKINKFTVELLNKWNRALKGVFVDVFVFKEGKEVDKVRTGSFDIEGKEMKKVEGYFDADKELGDYEFEVVVDYEGRKAHKRFEGSILEEEEYKEAKGEGLGSLVYVLIGVLFGLVVIIFIVLAVKRKNLQEVEVSRLDEGTRAGGSKEELERVRGEVIEKDKGENKKYTGEGNVFDRVGK